MDTRLKKSKKIRSFVYRMIAAGAVIAAIGTGILGREALINMYREGVGTLSGDLYYLTEFREYAAYLYHQLTAICCCRKILYYVVIGMDVQVLSSSFPIPTRRKALPGISKSDHQCTAIFSGALQSLYTA